MNQFLHVNVWFTPFALISATGSHVKLVSDFAGKIPFSDMLQDRRKRFLDGLRLVDNSVLQFMSVLV